MKILTLDKPSESSTPISVPLYLDNDVQSQPAVQITVPHFFAENPNWVSHVQVTNGYITVSKYGSPTVGFHIDDLVKILYNNVPEVNWPVRFTKQPALPSKPGEPAVVAINPGEQAMFTVECNSYKEYTLQWQQLDPNGVWQDCTSFTSPTFATNAAGRYRCKATNCRGDSFSESVIVNVNSPIEKK